MQSKASNTTQRRIPRQWTAAEEVTEVGYYVATLDGTGVSTDGGNQLAGNFSQAGTSFKQSLLVTHDGDLNLDGHVSDEEANAVIANLGSSDADWLAGDVDGDGIIAPADALAVLGNTGLNVLDAGESERLEGGPGNDTYSFETPIGEIPVTIDDLESGVDTVDFSRVADFASGNTGIVFDLSQGVSTVSVTGVDQWNLTVVGDVENVIGSSYHDVLTGNALRNRLVGLDGNDTLNGGIGDDQLEGGLGDDIYAFSGDISIDDLGSEILIELADQGIDSLDFQSITGWAKRGWCWISVRNIRRPSFRLDPMSWVSLH